MHNVRLNFTNYLLMKIPKNCELQQIQFNHSSGVNYDDFMKIYRKCIIELYSFLVNDTALPLEPRLRF